MDAEDHVHLIGGAPEHVARRVAVRVRRRRQIGVTEVSRNVEQLGTGCLGSRSADGITGRTFVDKAMTAGYSTLRLRETGGRLTRAVASLQGAPVPRSIRTRLADSVLDAFVALYMTKRRICLVR